MTTCEAAIKTWEEESKETAADAKKVLLYCQIPPISKMDGKLNDLKKCQHLSLSTNSIDRFGNLTLPELKILSVGRNHIKKIDSINIATLLITTYYTTAVFTNKTTQQN